MDGDNRNNKQRGGDLRAHHGKTVRKGGYMSQQPGREHHTFVKLTPTANLHEKQGSLTPELESGIVYSLDKGKRWELVEELKKTEAEQVEAEEAASASQSGSDESGSLSDEDPTMPERKIAVAQAQYTEGSGRVNKRLDAIGKAVRNRPQNEPLKDSEEEYEWTENRKGQQRKKRRAPGKNVNHHATHQDAHSEEALRIGQVDEIYHVHNFIPPSHAHDKVAASPNCRCEICNPKAVTTGRNIKKVTTLQFQSL